MKTTMSYHLTPVRMAIIKKTRNKKHWWGCGEKGIFVHGYCEYKLVSPILKTGSLKNVTPWLIHVNVWQNPLQYCKVISLQLIKIKEKKIKNRTTISSNNFSSRYLDKAKQKDCFEKRSASPCALLHYSQ